jgi:hypothetical protein
MLVPSVHIIACVDRSAHPLGVSGQSCAQYSVARIGSDAFRTSLPFEPVLHKCCLTPRFSGGALPPVPWHFMPDRPLQPVVMRLAGRHACLSFYMAAGAKSDTTSPIGSVRQGSHRLRGARKENAACGRDKETERERLERKHMTCDRCDESKPDRKRQKNTVEEVRELLPEVRK